jgi:hypothetical protein
MKRTLALVTILGACWSAVATADGGGPAPGPVFGQPGKLDAKRAVRYVALNAGSTSTVLETINIHDGNVVRWTSLRGMLGIPMVAWDGSVGGLSRDGRSLVLGSYPATARTSFARIDPRRMRVRAQATLPGAFAFDALSPDGSLMYVLQFLGKPENPTTQPYAVRVFDWSTRTLVPGAIVDKREPDEKMNGQPVARTGNPAGWVYTLYQRQGHAPFVHALDTLQRRAFCVDLPWLHSDEWVGSVKLRVQRGTLLMRRGNKVLARMNTKTLKVTD